MREREKKRRWSVCVDVGEVFVFLVQICLSCRGSKRKLFNLS